MNQTDKRQHLRYELIDFAIIEFEDDQTIQCVIVDISLGGLQVRSKVTLPVGKHCVMKIARRNDKPLEVRGEVRHSAPLPDSNMYASGFRFLPNTHNERMAIAEYMHEVFLRQAENIAS